MFNRLIKWLLIEPLIDKIQRQSLIIHNLQELIYENESLIFDQQKKIQELQQIINDHHSLLFDMPKELR